MPAVALVVVTGAIGAMRKRTKAEKECTMTDEEILADRILVFRMRLAERLRIEAHDIVWDESTESWALMKLQQGVTELSYVLDHGKIKHKQKVCLNIAAFAMMIWDRACKTEEQD